jgi:hypothetical protein
VNKLYKELDEVTERVHRGTPISVATVESLLHVIEVQASALEAYASKHFRPGDGLLAKSALMKAGKVLEGRK